MRGAPGNRSGLLPLARLTLTAATTSLARDRRGRPGIMVQGNCTGTTHAFSVRARRRRHPERFSRSGVRTPRPSTASRPAYRDDRERPSSGRDMRTIVLDVGKCQEARRPRNIPAMPRSSSRSGQWMPSAIGSKLSRAAALAPRKRGYQSSGVAILRPSATVTTRSLAVNATETGRRSPTSISMAFSPRHPFRRRGRAWHRQRLPAPD